MSSKVLILKTGLTIPPLRTSSGDFEDWIARDMGISQDQIEVIDSPAGQVPSAIGCYKGIVITGSPAMVTDILPWSEALIPFIQEAVDSSLPVLGICYGHQLLGHALGASVGDHPRGREIGTTTITLKPLAGSDPLFSQLPAQFQINVTHIQSVLEIPAQATVLGANDFDSFHAVRFADNAWGVQFHPEFDADVMAAYIRYRKDVLAKEGFEVEDILARVHNTPEACSLLRQFWSLL